MTLQEVKQRFHDEIKGLFSPEEINNFFFLIIKKEFGYSKAMTLLHMNDSVSMGESIMIHGCLNRLKRSEPIQYILRETEFYGLHFNVNRDTLIPRPETEELVDWIISDIQANPRRDIQLVDIGTGTGCIAISISASVPGIRAFGWDISEGALKVARKNAKSNKTNIYFERRDMLSLPEEENNFDIIVSNPPYVRESEKLEMSKNVLDYEPELALYVPDDDPLIYYRTIAQWARKVLKPKGSLYFEINEYLSKELNLLLEQLGFEEILVKKDFFGKDRMIRCSQHE